MLVCFLANESEEKIDSRLLSHIFAQRLEMGGKNKQHIKPKRASEVLVDFVTETG